jgi:hypothetical protein
MIVMARMRDPMFTVVDIHLYIEAMIAANTQVPGNETQVHGVKTLNAPLKTSSDLKSDGPDFSGPSLFYGLIPSSFIY